MKRTLHILIIIAAVFSLTTLACTLSGLPANTPIPTNIDNTPYPTLDPTAPPDPISELAGHQDRLIVLYQQVNPGVVAIRVLSEEGSGLGSGFVINEEGHIVTNYHVIRNATELEVDFPSGFKIRGEILGVDLDSDIAVLKVDAPPDELFPIPMGDSDLIQVGQTVVAIGNPLGLESTMTTGVVSSLGRTMQSLHAAPGGGSFTAGDIIQTDAAINPGNSGGPLLNLDGEVVGVNVAIQSSSIDITGQPVNSGLGFSVPINIVKRVVPYLIAEGYYDYPYMGIRTLPEINLFQQESLGLPRSTGVYITDVTPHSPADKAGLQAGADLTDIPDLLAGGDLITAIDGRETRNFGDLISYLLNHKSPGDTVIMSILRGDGEIELELTLGKRP